MLLRFLPKYQIRLKLVVPWGVFFALTSKMAANENNSRGNEMKTLILILLFSIVMLSPFILAWNISDSSGGNYQSVQLINRMVYDFLSSVLVCYCITIHVVDLLKTLNSHMS